MRTKKLKYVDKLGQHPNMKVHPSEIWPFSFDINWDELYWRFYIGIRDKTLLDEERLRIDFYIYQKNFVCLKDQNEFVK